MSSSNDHSFFTKGLWYITVGGAISAVAVSLFALTSYSVANVVAVSIATIVAVLVARHPLRVPGTSVRVQVSNVFALWGVMWLGLPGGILIAVAGSAAAKRADQNRDRKTFFWISSDVVSTITVGSIYYFVSGYVLNNDPAGANIALDPSWTMVAATSIMALCQFAISSIFRYAGRYINSAAGEDGNRSNETLLYLFLSCLVTIACTVIANYTFSQFGLEFGFVILPAAILGNVAYEIHLRRLALKTRQISDASRIHLATVEALATAIDARDQLGIGHVRRTQIFAVRIGEMLELSDSEISALRTGALLHDIGKLAVPDHILNKTDALTDAEAEKIKIHSSVGASILEKVGFDTPVVPTVKYHHECWDGTGYPEALKGENIPLTARILAVADAYDTLRGARPYRAAQDRYEARKMLRRAAGAKFDPRLVKLFLENLDRLEAEIDRKGLGYKESRMKFGRASADGEQNYVEQIKRANREASNMYELAKDFSGSLTLDETLKLFTDKVREFVSFDTCSVYLQSKDSADARAMFVAGKHAAVFNDHILATGDGITGQVLETRKAIASCDPWPDLQLLRSSVTTDFRSMIALPIMADENLVGAVSLYSTDPTGYSDEHVRLVETISHIAADSIVKSQRHAETESHALTDPMTGLPNARSLQLQFEREVGRASRNKSLFQVLMLDLDGFKQVNDTFGHKIGDKMLFEIGRIIKEQLREYDFLARYAGDEFVALVPGTSVEDTYELCRRIECAVDDFDLDVDDDTAHVGVSIGWSTYPDSGSAFDQLLIAADKEMYSTKSRRKKFGKPTSRVIPKPTQSLDVDMPIAAYIDEIDTVVEIDDEHIYVSPLV